MNTSPSNSGLNLSLANSKEPESENQEILYSVAVGLESGIDNDNSKYHVQALIFVKDLDSPPMVRLIKTDSYSGDISYSSIISLEDALLLNPKDKDLGREATNVLNTIEVAKVKYFKDSLFADPDVYTLFPPIESNNSDRTRAYIDIGMTLREHSSLRPIYIPALRWISSFSAWRLELPSFYQNGAPLGLGLATWNDKDGISALLEKMKDWESLWLTCALINPAVASQIVLDDKIMQMLNGYKPLFTKRKEASFKEVLDLSATLRKEEIDLLSPRGSTYPFEYDSSLSSATARYQYQIIAFFLDFSTVPMPPISHLIHNPRRRLVRGFPGFLSQEDKDLRTKNRKITLEELVRTEVAHTVKTLAENGWREVSGLKTPENFTGEGAWFTFISEEDWEILVPISATFRYDNASKDYGSRR